MAQMIMYNFIFFNLIQNNTTHLIPQGLKNITSNLSLLADEVDILVFTKLQWLYSTTTSFGQVIHI